MKAFLFRPFLSTLFPVDLRPAPFSTYSEQNHGYRRPNNVSEINGFITNAAQGGSTYSFVTRPLKYFVDQNVINLATPDLAVNTVIFAGNALAASDVPTVQNYASILTSNGNTLTVVLVDPTIDQTYYQQIVGLNIVVWSDSATTIAAIQSNMNCDPSMTTSTASTASTASDTTTSGTTTSGTTASGTTATGTTASGTTASGTTASEATALWTTAWFSTQSAISTGSATSVSAYTPYSTIMLSTMKNKKSKIASKIRKY
uniref:Uncharacterized protein n=1 Tax=Panagrolaimus sp. JU765 TaxID=591449 RepID=A0AC34R631_9BILA